jgi:hypothetical protein
MLGHVLPMVVVEFYRQAVPIIITEALLIRFHPVQSEL